MYFCLYTENCVICFFLCKEERTVSKPGLCKKKELYQEEEKTQPYQFSSVTQSCPTPCDPMDCSMPGFSVHHQLPELAQTHIHGVSDAIQPSQLLVVPFSSQLQSFPIRVFSNESILCIRWPKYWSFSFSISPSNEYSGLIFFRIDYFDLFAPQGTFNSLLQHHSSKASILRRSAFL